MYIPVPGQYQVSTRSVSTFPILARFNFPSSKCGQLLWQSKMPYAPQDDVEFRTLDGLTLRGWLYPASIPHGPAVIINCGFNMPKDVLAPQIARYFQKKGVTALVYDNRSIGLSDGKPENDIDPQKQVSDCHDAVTFLSQHPLVNPAKITLWGLSLSGAVALATAALDPRVAAVISLAPTAKLNIPPEKQATILRRAIDDRVAQVTKNAPPVYIPMVSEEDGSNLGGLPIDPQAIRQLERLSPHFKNYFTIQTSYRLIYWSILDLLPKIRCPVMVVAPERDAITQPEVQKAEVFDLIASEKRFEVIEGKGHWDWWEADGGLEGVLGVQLGWMGEKLVAS
ncbi:Alpha/Beta hydrolase protein [Hypomontagnella monticulosa]|nr:Alpha/Beta hydrolase protein [Hypomontagnella monticulosa]